MVIHGLKVHVVIDLIDWKRTSKVVDWPLNGGTSFMYLTKCLSLPATSVRIQTYIKHYKTLLSGQKHSFHSFCTRRYAFYADQCLYIINYYVVLLPTIYCMLPNFNIKFQFKVFSIFNISIPNIKGDCGCRYVQNFEFFYFLKFNFKMLSCMKQLSLWNDVVKHKKYSFYLIKKKNMWSSIINYLLYMSFQDFLSEVTITSEMYAWLI